MIYLLLLLATLIIIGIYRFFATKREKNTESSFYTQQYKKERKERKRKKELEKKQKELELYGKCSKRFINTGITVRVFDSTKNVLINGKPFSFEEIQDCTIQIDEKVIQGKSETTYTTKTSGKSMVGRSLVGAAIAGPIGAVIGGTTAKKETTGITKTIPDIINRKYYVTIGINRKGWTDIIYDTNDKDQAFKLKEIIDSIVFSKRNILKASNNHEITEIN